jgi:hypothetical protein
MSLGLPPSSSSPQGAALSQSDAYAAAAAYDALAGALEAAVKMAHFNDDASVQLADDVLKESLAAGGSAGDALFKAARVFAANIHLPPESMSGEVEPASVDRVRMDQQKTAAQVWRMALENHGNGDVPVDAALARAMAGWFKDHAHPIRVETSLHRITTAMDGATSSSGVNVFALLEELGEARTPGVYAAIASFAKARGVAVRNSECAPSRRDDKVSAEMARGLLPIGKPEDESDDEGLEDESNLAKAIELSQRPLHDRKGAESEAADPAVNISRAEQAFVRGPKGIPSGELEASRIAASVLAALPDTMLRDAQDAGVFERALESLLREHLIQPRADDRAKRVALARDAVLAAMRGGVSLERALRDAVRADLARVHLSAIRNATTKGVFEPDRLSLAAQCWALDRTAEGWGSIQKEIGTIRRIVTADSRWRGAAIRCELELIRKDSSAAAGAPEVAAVEPPAKRARVDRFPTLLKIAKGVDDKSGARKAQSDELNSFVRPLLKTLHAQIRGGPEDALMNEVIKTAVRPLFRGDREDHADRTWKHFESLMREGETQGDFDASVFNAVLLEMTDVRLAAVAAHVHSGSFKPDSLSHPLQAWAQARNAEGWKAIEDAIGPITEVVTGNERWKATPLRDRVKLPEPPASMVGQDAKAPKDPKDGNPARQLPRNFDAALADLFRLPRPEPRNTGRAKPDAAGAP